MVVIFWDWKQPVSEAQGMRWWASSIQQKTTRDIELEFIFHWSCRKYTEQFEGPWGGSQGRVQAERSTGPGHTPLIYLWVEYLSVLGLRPLLAQFEHYQVYLWEMQVGRVSMNCSWNMLGDWLTAQSDIIPLVIMRCTADGVSVALKPGFRVYSSNKLPDDANNIGPQTTLWGAKVRRQKPMQII